MVIVLYLSGLNMMAAILNKTFRFNYFIFIAIAAFRTFVRKGQLSVLLVWAFWTLLSMCLTTGCVEQQEQHCEIKETMCNVAASIYCARLDTEYMFDMVYIA